MNKLYALFGGLLYNFMLYTILSVAVNSLLIYVPVFVGINLVMMLSIDKTAKGVKVKGINPKKYLYIFTVPSLIVSIITYVYAVTKEELNVALMESVSIGIMQSFSIFALVYIVSIIFSYIDYNKYRYIIGGYIASILVPFLLIRLSVTIARIIATPFEKMFNLGGIENPIIEKITGIILVSGIFYELDDGLNSILCFVIMCLLICVGIFIYVQIIYRKIKDNYEIGDKIQNGEISEQIEDGTIYENKVKDYYKMYLGVPFLLMVASLFCQMIIFIYVRVYSGYVNGYFGTLGDAGNATDMFVELIGMLNIFWFIFTIMDLVVLLIASLILYVTHRMENYKC